MANNVFRIAVLGWALLGPSRIVGWDQTSTSVVATPCSTSQNSTATVEQVRNFIRDELFEPAECAARSLVIAHPDDADAHYLLGYVLNRRNEPVESLKEYTAGARYRKPAAGDLAVVALDYALLEDYADAEKWMSQASDAQPSNTLYLYYLGRIEYSLNAFDRARATFERALAITPNDQRDLYNLGLTYEGLGLPDRAVELYRQAIALQSAGGARDAQPYYDLGSLLLRENSVEQAIEMLRKARELDGSNPAIREALGKAEEQAGLLDESRRELELAVAAAPGVVSLHFELGRVYTKLHLQAQAKQQFDLCSRMNATHSTDSLKNLNFSRP